MNKLIAIATLLLGAASAQLCTEFSAGNIHYNEVQLGWSCLGDSSNSCIAGGLSTTGNAARVEEIMEEVARDWSVTINWGTLSNTGEYDDTCIECELEQAIEDKPCSDGAFCEVWSKSCDETLRRRRNLREDAGVQRKLSEVRQTHIEEGLCNDIITKIKEENAWPTSNTACHTLFSTQCEFVCKASLWAD